MNHRRAVSFCLSGGIALSAAAQQPVQEKVHVTVVEVTVHASRGSGEAVTGLTPRDLRLYVDRHDVPIESLEWVSNESAAAGGAPAGEHASVAEAPTLSGRLVVLFFQWHIEASKIE